MKNSKYLLSAALASGILVGMASFQAADAQEYIPKAKVKTLHQAPLPGVEGKEMVVKHVYVLEGELTVVLERETKTFKTGELYFEDINAAMVGKNLSATDDLEILVFQVGDIGKPMMLKVK